MIRVFRIGLLATFATSLAGAAPLPPGATRAGYTVTAEGGVEGTQVYRYDAEGRPIDGTPARSSFASPTPRPVSDGAPAARAAASAPVAQAPQQVIRTADGRVVPFSVQGKGIGKSVDEAVDFNASLKKTARTSDLLGQRFETGVAPLGKEQVYSRANLMTLDTWHGRYDTIGRKKADFELKDTLAAEVRTKDTVEVKSIGRVNSAISGTRADLAEWETRMGVDSNPIYAGVKSAWQGRLNPGPKTVDQLSMQDINRFQFRRNRSDEPGLPVVKPGSESVETRGGK